MKLKFCLFSLLFSGVFYTTFYYGFDFFAEDVLDDGIYKEVDMSEVGSATDINFTVKKAGIYEISFKSKKRKKSSARRSFPDTVATSLRSGFARKLQLLS